MNNLDEFKQFLKTIPSIKRDVVNHTYTWQQIYEIYTLYGKDDDFFKPYKNPRSLDINGLLDVVKNVDLDALSSSLQSLEKVLSLVSSMVVKDKGQDKWYNER